MDTRIPASNAFYDQIDPNTHDSPYDSTTPFFMLTQPPPSTSPERQSRPSTPTHPPLRLSPPSTPRRNRSIRTCSSALRLDAPRPDDDAARRRRPRRVRARAPAAHPDPHPSSTGRGDHPCDPGRGFASVSSILPHVFPPPLCAIRTPFPPLPQKFRFLAQKIGFGIFSLPAWAAPRFPDYRRRPRLGWTLRIASLLCGGQASMLRGETP